MDNLKYWIQKNLDQYEAGLISYREYLIEKNNIKRYFKISIKKYNKIEGGL